METAWQYFQKGSQSGCCLSTPDTYAKNPLFSRSILKYSGRSPALKKIIAEAEGLAAPYFYVLDRIQKNPEALDAGRNDLLESEKSELMK